MSWNHVKSTKTGEERKLRRKFQNYLFLFQTGKRKASLIFSCKRETWCSGQPEVVGMVTAGWDGISSWGETELRCCRLDAPSPRRCRYSTTLSLWALILTQSSRISVKSGGCGSILTCPCDPPSARALLDFVTHNKALATPTPLFQLC